MSFRSLQAVPKSGSLIDLIEQDFRKTLKLEVTHYRYFGYYHRPTNPQTNIMAYREVTLQMIFIRLSLANFCYIHYVHIGEVTSKQNKDWFKTAGVSCLVSQLTPQVENIVCKRKFNRCQTFLCTKKHFDQIMLSKT